MSIRLLNQRGKKRKSQTKNASRKGNALRRGARVKGKKPISNLKKKRQGELCERIRKGKRKESQLKKKREKRGLPNKPRAIQTTTYEMTRKKRGL